MKDGSVTIQPNGIPLGEGLFSGTGPISVTAGGDLSSGIYVTTGPVSIRSTGGNINIDTKLAEVLGNVAIRADSGSVNIDQEIANIRSGRNLAVTAGTNINLNRQIDALDDSNPLSITPVPGGTVNFTAGNNVNLNKDLATYDGPVNINALAGTLNIAWNDAESRTYQIRTGTAPITVAVGGNLSTGTPPPAILPAPDRSLLDGLDSLEQIPALNAYIADLLRSWVAFSTTGKLTLTSTGGNVTVDAPIPATTGEVSINAANAIVVNHKVLSNNQPITLTAGTGGITVNATDDDYGISTQLSHLDPPIIITVPNSPAIDPGSAPLTLRAAGDISITTVNGITTKGSLLVDTRGKILQGFIYNRLVGDNQYPSDVTIVADRGIDSFNANYSPMITVGSLFGDIHLNVDASRKTRYNGKYRKRLYRCKYWP